MDDYLADQSKEPSLPRSDLIDEVCTRFEAAWKAGERPKIEEFLPTPSASMQPEPIHELLLALVAYDLEWLWKTAFEKSSQKTPADGFAAMIEHKTPAAISPDAGQFPDQPRLTGTPSRRR